MAENDYFIRWSRQLSRDGHLNRVFSRDSTPGTMTSIGENVEVQTFGNHEEALDKPSTDPASVLGIERRYALDAAALLGGNEYLVSEMLDKFGETPFTETEKAGVLWMAKYLCPNATFLEILEILDQSESLNQRHLTNFFTPFHRERLPRILASALLYCSRFEDTDVIENLEDNHQRAILINMKHYPQVEMPLGEVHTGSGDKPVLCERVAFIYFRSEDDFPVPEFPTIEKPKSAARKISASLAHEKKMLSIINVFAILPIP